MLMATKHSTVDVLGKTGPASAGQIFFQALVLGLLLLLLINYKGAAGLNKIRQLRTTGSFHLATVQIGSEAGNSRTALSNTLAYLKIVWPALVFGVLISAAARTSLSRTPLRSLFHSSIMRNQLTGALAGAPLMLCSCCVAPIFPAVYQRTRKIAPALAMTLASPSLNPAALTLSFILFPWRIAGARLAMALLLVLLGSLAVAKIAASSEVVVNPEEAPSNRTWAGLLFSYGNSLLYVSLRTLPLVLLGIWASMWVMRKLPSNLGAIPGAHLLAVMVIALFATLLTLPSLFEIPLALSIVATGGPVAGAVAVLFAGPAINLPSLLVIGRFSTWKVALSLGATVWTIAVAGGLLVG
jgi:uncharacterized membrane protein YraQ (UPF0718 family)